MIAILDASALIYLMEGEATRAGAVQRELQQLAESEPTLSIALSHLSMLECCVGPQRRGDQESLDRFDALFPQPELVWVELESSVIELATRLRAHRGLRTPDALQAASCLQLGGAAVMLTGDADFRRVSALRLRLISG